MTKYISLGGMQFTGPQLVLLRDLVKADGRPVELNWNKIVVARGLEKMGLAVKCGLSSWRSTGMARDVVEAG